MAQTRREDAVTILSAFFPIGVKTSSACDS